MHLTTPKSSKGRSKPATNNFLSSSDSENIQRPSECPLSSEPDRSFPSRSQPDMWQARRLTEDEVFHMLQNVPAVPSPSLNKYKVLPSIGKKQPEENSGKILNKMMPMLHGLGLSDDAVTQTCGSEEDGRVRPHRVTPDTCEEARAETRGPDSCKSLLLAVRTPCGRRFQQYFSPSDTLLTVRGSAEARSGTRLGEVSIGTMDVPRRTFTDLNMTLEQCGILNRSVLYISHCDEEQQRH